MHLLSFDFQTDVTCLRRHVRFSNVIRRIHRTALAIIPHRSFKAAGVVAVLEGIIAVIGDYRPMSGAIMGLSLPPARLLADALLQG